MPSIRPALSDISAYKKNTGMPGDGGQNAFDVSITPRFRKLEARCFDVLLLYRSFGHDTQRYVPRGVFHVTTRDASTYSKSSRPTSTFSVATYCCKYRYHSVRRCKQRFCTHTNTQTVLKIPDGVGRVCAAQTTGAESSLQNPFITAVPFWVQST